jgi:tetratricopeptide (TPR) repeat protein
MHRILSFAAVLVCLCAAVKSQTAPPAPPAKSVAEPAKSEDFSGEGYVIEKLRTSYTFENDGTGKRETYARIRVQSEAALQQWGQLVVGYSSTNERVEIPYVRVIKSDGTTITAPPDSVQDLSSPVEREAPMYSDYRQKHITVPGLRPGEVLEYDIVTNIQTAIAPGQFWMEHSFAKNGIVLDEQLELNIPSARKITLENQPGNDPKVTEENGRRIYRWTSSHREREDQFNDKPKKKKSNKPEPPSVQMTTFANWEELGRWYAALEKDRRTPTDAIRKRAAELTAGKTTDLDKVEALYDFVATNFRYVSLSFGTGRYQPHAATDVLNNQYGDCKDKHTLLASLLEASGYHLSSVLINSTRKLDPDVPSPSQFDHVISLLPLGTDEIWMDTTTEVAPFRLLAATLRKKQALVIPVNGVPHLEETPADPPMMSEQLQVIDGKVNEVGKLNAHVKVTVRGDVELLLRILFRRIPRAEWPQFVKRISSISGLDGEVSNLKITEPAATHEPFNMEYDIAAANFLDWSRKKSDLVLPMADITMADVDEDDPGPDPIQLGAPMEYVYRVRLEFPAKYVARAPVPFSMERDYADYQATYKVEGTVLTAERILHVRQGELPSQRASDYSAFHRAVLADVAQKVSVDGTAAVPPTAVADLKGDDLSDAAKAAMQRGNFQAAVDLLKRLLDSDPKNKTAWLSLGNAYMSLHQTDAAIDAFKKQAELNPYDEYAYNSLGYAYSREHNYDQAAIALQKAIEINPLSKFAHGGLGGLYSEQHKYELAVPEFEKATSLSPDNPSLQINLGDAYLNLGQDDKALAAFDRAIDISATPLVWNDIAYQLALKKTHLDRAQQYAESAVAATVAASRNLSLEQLNDRDLGTIRALAAYWFISPKAIWRRLKDMWARRGKSAVIPISPITLPRFTQGRARRERR